jgi:hypothetical protein
MGNSGIRKKAEVTPQKIDQKERICDLNVASPINAA